ncbi:MAG TPA: AAA family ATPase [Streptosporangiaceae bacterium]|nr:AAA family ATPase [Streptosporangiaceae bacterium]
MSAMHCQVLIGREAELGVLSAALDQTSTSGGLVVLAGEAGVGKSRISRELASLATTRGYTVVCGRAVQASSPVPLRPFIEALIAVARTTAMEDLPALAEYRHALASIVPDWGDHGESAAELSPLILGEAVLRLLSDLGGKGTVLILEDLHFADPESVAIVEYLADHLAGERVLCLATLRDTEPSLAQDMVRAVHARRSATVIDIPRLNPAEVEQMAVACLGQPSFPSRMIRRLLADSEGLPFAVEEILADAVSSGELVRGHGGWQVNESVTTGVPTSIAESVRRRLTELGPQVSDVVSAAAVLGRQFDWSLLPAIVRADESDVLKALGQACDAQLIEPHVPRQALFRFRHSLTRDAIMSDLLQPFLAERSAAAATAIEAAHPGLPGEWCELAAELHEAAGERARAAGLLLEAGRRALQRGALTSAAASLDRAKQVLALVVPAPVQMLADIDETLANVYTLTGNCDQLVPTADRLLAELEQLHADNARKALIHLTVARSLSECDHAEMAADRVAAARALADSTPDSSLCGWADAVAARCAMDSSDPDRALQLARTALASAEATMSTAAETENACGAEAACTDETACAADAACEALEVIGRRERVRDTAAANAAFERAFQIATSNALPVRRIRAMHELGTIEMLEEAKAHRLEEAKGLAIESGAVSTAAVLDLQLANAWSLGSDTDRAIEAARRSQAAAHRLRLRRVEAAALAVQACILAVQGDREYSESLAGQAELIAPDDPSVLITTWGEARVTSAIVGNDLASALRLSRTGISHGRNDPLTAPAMAWGYWALLEAIAYQDGTSALDEAVSAGAEVTCWNRGLLAYARAVQAGRRGEKARAGELAEAGRQYFLGLAPWWNHILHRLVATAALHDGWGEPVAWLRDAAADLDEGRFALVGSACRGILRKAGERVPRQRRGGGTAMPAELRRLGITKRELDVFVLIGQGCSNAEIGSRLVISTKTVESHVTSIIMKAGLSCRRELVAFAARPAACT